MMVNVKYLPEDETLNIEFEAQNIVEPTTDRSLKNIKKTLIYSLRREYKITDINKLNEIADKILKIHGLHKDNFDFVKQAGLAIQESINDFSIDDNANKSDKNPKSIIYEVTAPIHKLIGYDYLYQIMRELYSKKEAKRLSGLMYDYTLALADTTNVLLPYCWSFDATRVITEGKRFGQLESSPAHRIDSYISILNEVIHAMSNNLAGAIAIGTFFMDLGHLGIYKDEITLETLRTDKATQKMLENQYQKIVHGFNSLSRNGGTESPFTNISILDRSKLATVLNDDNGYFDMLFANNKGSKVFLSTGIDVKDKEAWKAYVIEYIIEMQNMYMRFFDKGDPLTDGMPYRFPVTTLNLGKSYTDDKGWTIDDKQFLKSACKKDVFRYNIFVSEGTKFASCCRLISNTELMDMASQVNSFGGGGSTSIGSHRVITTNFARVAYQSSSKEDFYKLLEEKIEDSAKILKAHKQLIVFLQQKKLQPFIAMGWIRMDRMFSTFGVIGIVECAEILKEKYGASSSDLVNDILTFYNSKVSEYGKKYDIMPNIEQIPGESMMLRLPKADKLIYEEAHFDIYANQFIPLWDDTSSIFERIEIDGKYNLLYTGGGIVHLNVGEEITAAQAELLISRAVKAGCEHFAVTSTMCLCENGHRSIGDSDVCPVCQGKILEKRARTVGFWTPVTDWKKEKQILDHSRRKEYTNGDFIEE
jgi:ribonucleoside-triphosphate reductase